MIREIIHGLLDELLELPAAVKDIAKESWKLLRAGWRFLLRKGHEKLTGATQEEDPSLLEFLVALKIAISGLPKKQQWAAYAGCVAVVAAVGLLIGVAVTPNPGKPGNNSGGSGISIGNHTYYQPEFSKLDCLTCDGDGDCNTCRGYGEVERYAGAGDTVRSKCSSCYGSGNCRTCGGSGKR